MYPNQCYNTKNNLKIFINFFTFLYFVLFYVLSLIYQITNKTKKHANIIYLLTSISINLIYCFCLQRYSFNR